MSRWTFIYLILAIITGAMGFGGITSSLAAYAQIPFVIFLALLLISLVAGLVGQAESHSDIRD